MAQKKSTNTKSVSQSAAQPVVKNQGVKPEPVKNSLFAKHYVWVILAALLTFIAMSPSLSNLFTNWDDPGYIVNQPVIKDLSAAGLKNIFSTSIMGNYHPLTMLTLAIDYAVGNGLDAHVFHMHSLLFHILTTISVYFFVAYFFKNKPAGFLVAVLFGVHPMHVESVAWVAARKDVVYGLFYVLSCLSYVAFLRNFNDKKNLWLGLTFLCFVLSILGKPVAVVLPLTLLLIDYWEGSLYKGNALFEGLNMNAIIYKIPFFVVSVFAGIRSMQDQKAFGASGGGHYTFINRIELGGYAFMTYIGKALAPVKLKCFYPYPMDLATGKVPLIYLMYPILAVGLIVLAFFVFRKNKIVVFGAGFFLVNIVLLLQFIPVGSAIVAERYSYIPYIGLFMIPAGFLAVKVGSESFKNFAPKLAMVFVPLVGWFSFLSYERCAVWFDGMSLWRDEIVIEPNLAPNGYNNLGYFYFEKYNGSPNPADRKVYYDSCVFLLKRAIEIDPNFVNPRVTLGELHRASAIYDQSAGDVNSMVAHILESKSYYYAALKMDSGEQAANAYIGLAIIYALTRNNDSSQYCFNKTFQLKPYNPEAHSNYANFLDMNGRHEEALKEYTTAIEQNRDIVPPWLNRARCLQRMNRCDEAMKDFETALKIAPDMGEIYYAMSMCYASKNDKRKAMELVQTAQSKGFRQMNQDYVNSLK